MLVKSLLESRDFDLSILATREQVARLDGKIDKIESNLNTKIDKVESNLEKQISATREQVSNVETQIKELSNTISSNKYDIIKWMVTLFITMITAIYLKR